VVDVTDTDGGATWRTESLPVVMWFSESSQMNTCPRSVPIVHESLTTYLSGHQPVTFCRVGQLSRAATVIVKTRDEYGKVVALSITEYWKPWGDVNLVLFHIKRVDSHNWSPEARHDPTGENYRERPGDSSKHAVDQDLDLSRRGVAVQRATLRKGVDLRLQNIAPPELAVLARCRKVSEYRMHITSSCPCPVAATVKTALRTFRGNVKRLLAVSGGTVKTLAALAAACCAETGRITSAGLVASGAEKKEAVSVTLKAAV